jgi:hypothetical protein
MYICRCFGLSCYCFDALGTLVKSFRMDLCALHTTKLKQGLLHVKELETINDHTRTGDNLTMLEVVPENSMVKVLHI